MVHSPKSEASHDSSSAARKIHAPNDRRCQYCQHHFTSSSLGRHLDQFLFRKKPDGIHDVEEIRRLRGSITRRTAKASAKAKQDRERCHSTPQTTPPVDQRSPAGNINVDLNATPVDGYRVRVNAPNWQSTGVINGLPGPSTVEPASENVNPTTGKRIYSSIETAAAKDILGLRGDLGYEKETTRALELALREVLDCIQAARVKTTPTLSPFPIDIQSHTFSSLILHLLPPPPTLLTCATPFATSESFPVSSTPDHTHLNLLRSTISSLVTTWKSGILRLPVPPHHPDIHSYTSYVNSTASIHSATALQHLDLAYKHYVSLPKPQQQETWQTELARAFALERRKRKEAEERLEAATAEARQLAGQVEKLSRYQWPREMALFPPDRRPIRSNIIREMDSVIEREAKRRKTNSDNVDAGETVRDPEDEDEDEDDKRWDYDTLVGKWKKIVCEDTARKRVPSSNMSISTSAAGAGGNTVVSSNNTFRSSSTYSGAVTAPLALPPPTTITTTTTTREDQPPAPAFEPWTPKPPFMEDYARMMGIRVSKDQELQQHQVHPHQPPSSSQRHSSLNDLIMESPQKPRNAGNPRPPEHGQNGVDGGYASENGVTRGSVSL